MALAGKVIASHFAEPLLRRVAGETELYSAPDKGSETLLRLDAGDSLAVLECAGGWAWGYAGPERLVGYVPAGAVAG